MVDNTRATLSHLISGRRIPWPMMKCSFSRFDVTLSSRRALLLLVYSPSFNFVVTCSVIFDFFFRVSETNFFRTVGLLSFIVGVGSLS